MATTFPKDLDELEDRLSTPEGVPGRITSVQLKRDLRGLSRPRVCEECGTESPGREPYLRATVRHVKSGIPHYSDFHFCNGDCIQRWAEDA